MASAKEFQRAPRWVSSSVLNSEATLGWASVLAWAPLSAQVSAPKKEAACNPRLWLTRLSLAGH